MCISKRQNNIHIVRTVVELSVVPALCLGLVHGQDSIVAIQIQVLFTLFRIHKIPTQWRGNINFVLVESWMGHFSICTRYGHTMRSSAILYVQ